MHLKKINVFIQIETSNVSFFVLQKLVFQIWLWPTWRTFLCASFGCIWKKISSSCASTHFWKVNIVISSTKSLFQTFIFFFFRNSKTCSSNMTLINLKTFFCLYFDSKKKKKINSYGASMHIFKWFFSFLTQIETSNVTFSLFQ